MDISRKLQKELIIWFKHTKRKPLLLRGARQVGKTYLLKSFGKTHFENTAYFNFEEQPELKQFFQQTKDVRRILENLSLVYGKRITHQNTLIIFDEIQECNEALNSLKYFHENAPEFAIACAWSLLGVAPSKGQSFPVGQVEFLEVHPISFSEFLSADDPSLFSYLENIENLKPLPDIFFNSLTDKLKKYFISGGKPESVINMVESQDTIKTQQILQNILNSYSLDFSKYADSKDVPKINFVWQSIPSQLAKENRKFLYQAVKAGARASEYEDALLWLSNAGLVHRIFKISKPGLLMSAYDDLTSFKLYMLDVGLLRKHATLDPSAILEGNRLFTEFKGALSENYILQHLVNYFEITPRYWTSDAKAKVDFVIQINNQIIPIEVKSDDNTHSGSLALYHKKYNPPFRLRYSLKNLKFDNGLLNIPLFMVDYTQKLLDLAAVNNTQNNTEVW